MASLALDRLDLMGKPHIGPLMYVGKSAKNATCCEEFASCEICGRVGTNAHHLVPKGIGGGSSTVLRNGELLRSPCIVVCGSGNASGCHKCFHDGTISVRWDWDVPEYGESYANGELRIKPHSDEFFNYGSYVILFANGHKRRYRR